MLRRSLVCFGVLAVGLVLVASAVAARVHVRVEGKYATLAGRAEPLVTPTTGTFSPPDGPALTLPQPTALGALDRVTQLWEVYYRVQSTGFGPYVDRIGRRAAAGAAGWVYKVNGVSPPVGADQYVVRAGDRVLWYWADFSAGSPKTLDLRRASTNCFRAWALDDNGVAVRAKDVFFKVDGGRRHVASASGRICLGRQWHKVRVLKDGMVRSRVIAKRG